MGVMKRIATANLDRTRTASGAVAHFRLELYFDKLRRAVRSKQRRVLFKTGSYTLKSLRRSMRYRKTPSKPYSPPSAHKDNHSPGNAAALRNKARFDVNLHEGSVVVGPMKFGKVSQPSGKPVPQLLDEGGPVIGFLKGKSVIAELAPRPFVRPAFIDGGEQFEKLIAAKD